MSQTDIAEPKRNMPKIATELPTRPNDLKDKDEPICPKSSKDTAEPKRANDRIDIALPT